MNALRFWAPALSTLFGLSSANWGIVDSSVPIAERIGGAFLGGLFLLLAIVSARRVPREQEENKLSDWGG